MIYRNLDPETPRSFRDLLRWQRERRRLPPSPPELSQPASVLQNDGSPLRQGGNSLTWVGHASVVVRLDEHTVLCDPVWSPTIPGFIPRLAPTGLALEALPRIDVVLISHNHYDHLDLPTLRRLGLNTQLFVPAGLQRYFHGRGFTKVREFNWWESAQAGSLQVTFVPAQHWSRRLPWDTNQSWWGGWVIEGSQRVYFAGDTGFFSGFVRIADRFPALDCAMLPIGAYEPRWFMQPVHMNPEEAGAAFALLGAKHMVPLHYGTFKLTDEPIGEPLPRLQAWWHKRGLDPERLWLPAIGETLRLDRGFQ